MELARVDSLGVVRSAPTATGYMQRLQNLGPRSRMASSSSIQPVVPGPLNEVDECGTALRERLGQPPLM
jgi:hypothetical protein